LAALALTLNDFLDRVHAGTVRERRMVSDAAHELRTPLAALRTQLELAHDDFGDAEALAREIRGAETSVARLTALATGLLELSRIDGDDSPQGRATTAEVVDESMLAVDRARMIALAKQVDVSFSTDGLSALDTYAIEPAAFGRLLDNLFSNALNAVGDEGVVELTLRNDDGMLEVEVVDNGPGVPASFLPTAFDRFSRPDESRTASAGGSGLGLALVRAIAESAGGTAQLSNGESGARALIRLPNM
jgi:signal transduction histidine kinase